MDKIQINQNIMIEIKEPNSDLTIVPIALNLEFLAKFRDGPKYLFG
jgi:hypothetical protein